MNSFCPRIRRSFTHPANPTLPEHALCSHCPLCPVSCQSCQLRFPGAQGGVPAKAKLQLLREHSVSSGLVCWSLKFNDAHASTQAGFRRLHCLQLTPAEAQSGGGPAPPQNWNAKSLRQMVELGRARVGGSSSCSGRRRENQPGSVTETNWWGEERVLSTALSVLNLGRERTSCSLCSRQRPLPPSVPGRTLFTSWTLLTW